MDGLEVRRALVVTDTTLQDSPMVEILLGVQGEVARPPVAHMAMKSNIPKLTDPQEIIPVLQAAW